MAVPIPSSEVLKDFSHGLFAVTGQKVLIEDAVSVIGM
jgi:hypothetical protein